VSCWVLGRQAWSLRSPRAMPGYFHYRCPELDGRNAVQIPPRAALEAGLGGAAALANRFLG